MRWMWSSELWCCLGFCSQAEEGCGCQALPLPWARVSGACCLCCSLGFIVIDRIITATSGSQEIQPCSQTHVKRQLLQGCILRSKVALPVVDDIMFPNNVNVSACSLTVLLICVIISEVSWHLRLIYYCYFVITTNALPCPSSQFDIR